MKELKLKRKIYADQVEAMKTLYSDMGEVLVEMGFSDVCLTGHSSLTTAFMNYVNADLVFVQQVNLCIPKYLDLGNSKVYAAITAKLRT